MPNLGRVKHRMSRVDRLTINEFRNTPLTRVDAKVPAFLCSWYDRAFLHGRHK